MEGYQASALKEYYFVSSVSTYPNERWRPPNAWFMKPKASSLICPDYGFLCFII